MDLGNDQRYEAALFVVIEHNVGDAYKNKNGTVMGEYKFCDTVVTVL